MVAVGTAAFLALLLILAKLPRRLLLRVPGYDALLDVSVTLHVMFNQLRHKRTSACSVTSATVNSSLATHAVMSPRPASKDDPMHD